MAPLEPVDVLLSESCDEDSRFISDEESINSGVVWRMMEARSKGSQGDSPKIVD